MGQVASATSQPVFGRATRFAGRENRLTEVFAAVLERVPGLAWNLARIWTDPARDHAAPGELTTPATGDVFTALLDVSWVSVRTQVRTTSHKQVDLALRFGSSRTPSPDDVLVWVEVKHGAAPHEGQLANYAHGLPRDVGTGAIVLLAPRGSLPFDVDDVPDSVPQRSWQAVARCVRDELQRQADPIATFLLEEFYVFMQQESLADPDVLRPEHFVVFAYADAADSGLTTICERASQLVAHGWGRAPDEFEPAPRTRKPAFGWGYWEAWGIDKQRSESGKTWLDWSARNEPAHPEADGRSLVFIAGLSAERLEDLTLRLPPPQRLATLEGGVRIDGRLIRFKRISDDIERFAAVGFPEELLVGRSVEEQASSLASWILDVFKALTQP